MLSKLFYRRVREEKLKKNILYFGLLVKLFLRVDELSAFLHAVEELSNIFYIVKDYTVNGLPKLYIQ